MSSILDDESHIVFFRKIYSSSDGISISGLNGVGGRSSQLARWIRDYRSIDWGARINEWIAVSGWRFRDPEFICPIRSNALTFLGAVSRAVVACFGERLVLN